MFEYEIDAYGYTPDDSVWDGFPSSFYQVPSLHPPRNIEPRIGEIWAIKQVLPGGKIYRTETYLVLKIEQMADNHNKKMVEVYHYELKEIEMVPLNNWTSYIELVPERIC